MNAYENGVIKYQISLERYKNGIANEVIQLLDNANIEIAGYIKKTRLLATASFQAYSGDLRYDFHRIPSPKVHQCRKTVNGRAKRPVAYANCRAFAVQLCGGYEESIKGG